jgi:GT2 family glycosyltransferase
MATVTVIVVNYNGSRILQDCLNAVEKQSLRHFEVIVVDNGSTDHSLNQIKTFAETNRKRLRFKLIEVGENRGFAGGCLEGLRHSSGEYIALLNNDAVPDKHWLEGLLEAMDSHPQVGIVASKIIVEGTDVIDSAGDEYSTSLKPFKYGEGKRADNVMFDQPRYAFGACACAALYRRQMIDSIGFMDEDFFLIHEDSDLSFRAQLHGWRVLYVPTAIVHHKVRSSIGKMTPVEVYYTVRNNEFVRMKNVPSSLFVRYLPWFVMGMVSEFAYYGLKHRYFGLYVRAKIDALKMSSVMFIKRKKHFRRATIGSRELQALITPALKTGSIRSRLKRFFPNLIAT